MYMVYVADFVIYLESYLESNRTLRSDDCDSFAVAILSRKHREIDIAESILARIKVIIEGVFPMMVSGTIWPPVWRGVRK